MTRQLEISPSAVITVTDKIIIPVDSGGYFRTRPGVVRRTEVPMKLARSVLLVHNEPDAFRGLEEMLREQEIQTCHAYRCAEARSMLKESGPIDLVLTDAVLPDGTWKDVIWLLRRLAKDTPVIVMSRVVNMRLYLDTQDAGAADFIVPPMPPRDLTYVLTGAMQRTVPPESRVRRATPPRMSGASRPWSEAQSTCDA